MIVSEISMNQAMDYELHSSWWAGWIGNDALQSLAGRYFAWKVGRKYTRYMNSKKIQEKYSKLGE